MRPSSTRLRGRSAIDRAAVDALDLADAAARRWLPHGRRSAGLHRALTQHRPPVRHRMAPLLEAFAQVRPRAQFIQIGAPEDGSPLQEVILGHDWRGVIVDPLPAALSALGRTYGRLSRTVLVQAAIGLADGQAPFYYVAPTPEGPGRTAGQAHEEPPKGSLQREVLYFASNYSPDLDERVAEVSVRCLTFASLCQEYGLTTADVLAINTEGDEAEILGQVDLSQLRPTLVVYDQRLLGEGVRRRCTERLAGAGYDLFVNEDQEVWAFNPTYLEPQNRRVLTGVWRWACGHDPQRPLAVTRLLRAVVHRATRNGDPQVPIAFPLTDEERQYLTTGYDARTPIAPDAAAYLSSQNPRLLDLRRAYAELGVAAVQHHYWNPEAVASGVDLRYFRGDNLYVWHYPEHPRAMELKLFVYLKYLEDRGGRELLERLDEDGAFGCWTAEIPGYGKVSRDLLDSVNEILFLDRELRLLTTPGLRVLDIGAGYGRLGHRMTAAAPGLADYCCVDAIPESTFLSEFYLDYRGCSPPTRVVRLDEVAGLEAGAFDLAVNVHSFSECTIDAISWWVEQLRRLQVPRLFVVPNEPEGILSRERDGSYHSALPVLAAAGYRPVAKERAISDRAVRDLVMIVDNFYLFSLAR